MMLIFVDKKKSMCRAMNGLWTCWDEIVQELTPVLCEDGRRPALLFEAADNALAFLHALCAAAINFQPKKWKGYALWIDDGALSPSMITVTEHPCKVAVTKSGKHLVWFNAPNRILHVASLDGGTFVRWFADVERTYDMAGVLVDASQGLIWVRQYYYQKILCYTEDNQLIQVIQLNLYPKAVAIFSDGRLLVAEFDMSTMSSHRLLLVSSTCEHPVIFIESSVHLPKAIHDMQVCVQTGEIYVLSHKGEVSIFSAADGAFLSLLQLCTDEAVGDGVVR